MPNLAGMNPYAGGRRYARFAKKQADEATVQDLQERFEETRKEVIPVSPAVTDTDDDEA